ncbi:MAG: hypothetical protein RIS24_380 [Verrucomicrobiota bacterium]|jgi:hypothetical protein
MVCHRSLARRERNHGGSEKKLHRIMSHQMPANVLKLQCFQRFHTISEAAGEGLVVMGRARNCMNVSLNQEDSNSL